MMKTSRTAFAGLALALFTVNPASAETCPAINEYMEWRGADAYRNLQSTESIGLLKTGGLEGPARQAMRRDGYSYFEFAIQAFEGITAVTPEGGWEKSLSGQVGDMGEAQTAANRRSIDDTFALSLTGQGSGQVSCQPSEEKDGKTYNVIRTTFDDGNWFDYFVTPETGALDWTRSQRDTATTWAKQSDWKQIDGIRFPHLIESIEEVPEQNATLAWHTITPNKDLPTEDFAKPIQATSLLSFADDADTTGWMDFNFHRQRRLVLNAKVNGNETTVLLDSGAEATAVDKSFADSIGLVGKGDLTARGVAGTAQVSIAEDVDIEIGNLKASGLTVIILDLAAIGERIGHPLNVIFGEEVFNELIVDIDFPNERIAFHKPESFSEEGLGSAVPISAAQGGQKDIAVTVNGNLPALVGLDTGSFDTITFFKPWTDANGVLDGIKTSTRVSGGVGGRSIGLMGTVKSIQVGSHTLDNVPVTFFRSDEGAFATTEIDGNMGVQIFRQFRTSFDFGNARLFLTAPESGLTHTYDRNRTGLQTTKKGATLEVTHVAKESPAEARNWKEGDVIIAINDEPIGSDYWQSQYRWDQCAPGTKLKLSTRDGRQKRLVCRDFY